MYNSFTLASVFLCGEECGGIGFLELFPPSSFSLPLPTAVIVGVPMNFKTAVAARKKKESFQT